MAAIDKIYVNSWDEYLQFKEWCEQQSPLLDKYGKSVRITEYLYQYNEPFEKCHPIFNAPYYVDAYVVRNCPFDFIQKELMVNYGYWSQERIKGFYEDIINWKGEDKCPYWAKPEDFVIYDDGTMELKGIEESDYEKIKKGELYSSPLTDYKYTAGKHFRCVKHPKEFYNRPFKMNSWFVDIETPDDAPWMWYHRDTNTWDFFDEFVEAEWTSSAAHIKTIKALKRLIIKWKLPIGTIVRVTGRYRFDDYKFIVKR